MTEKKRIGRPAKPAVPGQRHSLGLKVTGEMKQRLEDAARASGRTQSQEAELRIEMSFRDEQLFQQAGERFYGPELAPIISAVTEAMRLVGELQYMLDRPGPDAPEGFDFIRRAAVMALDQMKPAAEPPPMSDDNLDFIGHVVSNAIKRSRDGSDS
jgi:hypothetical protein